jgi:hypothetical protein
MEMLRFCNARGFSTMSADKIHNTLLKITKRSKATVQQTTWKTVMGVDVVLFLTDVVAGMALAWARLGRTAETHAHLYHERHHALMYLLKQLK